MSAIIEQETGVQSQILRISVRAWVCLLLVLTVCAMSLLDVEIKEPLYTLAGSAVGFYFGGGNNKRQQP